MTDGAEEVFSRALKFDDYRSRMRVHDRAFAEHYRRLAFVTAAETGNEPLGDARILVLTEDYCIDSVLNLPLIARLADASPASELRITRRDAHAGLAARFPGRGGISRLPTVIFLGAPGEVLGYWSERSKADHAWMERFLADDPMPDFVLEQGVPTPRLAAWMERRFAAQAPIYQAQGWRRVRDELLAQTKGRAARTTRPS